MKKGYELDKQAFQDLDQTTRVPHLLIEIRSLGFVEIQGKDTGGIYKRLEALEVLESALLPGMVKEALGDGGDKQGHVFGFGRGAG